MIISRTPFRVSFAGGGSDMPEFFRDEPGMVLSTTIDKFMFISVHPYFHKDRTLLKYSRTEEVDRIADIQHPIIREVLQLYGLQGLDISSTADIPAGTGLGSSSTFTVGLLHALAAQKGFYAGKEYLGATACEVEIERLKEPIGKQDQYAAAYGGLNFISFYPDGQVGVESVVMQPQACARLEHNLLMFYTGTTRSASAILREQGSNISSSHDKKAMLRQMCGHARTLRSELERNNLDSMGEILHESWLLKKKLASGISNPEIDVLYDRAMAAGALGGKLLGAGGGGFLLFYVPDEHHDQVRLALSGLQELQFRFDRAGSIIVYNN